MDNTRGLFRGKRTDNGEWVEGFYVHLIDPYKERESHRIYTGLAESEAGTFYPEWFSIYPDTLGRYTGLTDKNGKRIFEGDILRITQNTVSPITAKVFCSRGAFRTNAAPEYDGEEPLSYWLANDCELEAIGNIHDNPELMEAEA